MHVMNVVIVESHAVLIIRLQPSAQERVLRQQNYCVTHYHRDALAILVGNYSLVLARRGMNRPKHGEINTVSKLRSLDLGQSIIDLLNISKSRGIQDIACFHLDRALTH